MIADAFYRFERKELLTSYILQEHKGASFDGFPAVYQRTPHSRGGASYPHLKGKQYVNFRTTENKLCTLQKECFAFCLSLASARYPVGLNFISTFTGAHRAAGNNRCMPRNDCYLVELTPDWNQIFLWVFFGRGFDEQELFKEWNSGAQIGVAE